MARKKAKKCVDAEVEPGSGVVQLPFMIGRRIGAAENCVDCATLEPIENKGL